MASKWFTTLEETRAQFGGYHVNPEIATERTLTRVWYGIDKSEFPTLKATLDATTKVTYPMVDNQTYVGTWRITDIRTEEGRGELEGSLTVYEDIRNELYDGQGEDNEYLAGMQSQTIDLLEYRWMVYQHYKQTTTKKWVSMISSAAVEGFEYLSKINYRSDIRDSDIEYLSAPTSNKYWNAIYYEDRDNAGYSKFFILDTWSRHFYEGTTYWRIDNTEITNPTIENCYYQEEKDHSFTLYRSLSELTYPAFMRKIYYQYAGLIKTASLPVEDSNTIWVTGFLNATETVYQHARFRIGGDTYRVTEDAEYQESDGDDPVRWELKVTPTVTAATEAAHTADASNTGAQVFFNAIG